MAAATRRVSEVSRMQEPDFTGLRLLLEAQTVPPPFAVIGERRRRRTRRATVLAAAALTLAVLAGAALVRPHVHRPGPVEEPRPTPTASVPGSGQRVPTR